MSIQIIKHTSFWDETIRTHHMESRGIAFYNSYFFRTIPDEIYFTDLHVTKDFRKKGIAQELLNYHINTSVLQGFKKSYLWCEKGSFMEKWYRNNGYEFFKNKDEKEVWLFKRLV